MLHIFCSIFLGLLYIEYLKTFLHNEIDNSFKIWESSLTYALEFRSYTNHCKNKAIGWGMRVVVFI